MTSFSTINTKVNSLSNINEWLIKNFLHPDTIDVKTTVSSFIKEMEKGLTAQGSSLPMIPTYIDMSSQTPINESVIAIDVGGTNLRVACVRFDSDGIPSIEEIFKYIIPGKEKEISIEEFFECVADYIAPLTKGKTRIGFCFSFPAKIHPDKDGEIILFDKEVKVKNAAGQMLGKGIISALIQRGIKNIQKIVVLNDTVAAALGARAQLQSRQYGGYIGFILGTGMNMCYSEKTKNISKEPRIMAQDSLIVINTEAALFNKVKQGPIDIELDESSHDPGMCQLEKMISGAYIGEVFNRAIIKASEDRLVDSDLKNAIRGSSETMEFSEFLDNPSKGIYGQLCRDEQDRQTLLFIGKTIVERAAKLAASCLLAVALKSGEGQNSLYPIFVSVEGTTVKKLKGLWDGINYHINNDNDIQRVFLEMGSLENTTIYGSAIAAYL